MVQLAVLNYGSVLSIDFDQATHAVWGLKRKNIEPAVVFSGTFEPLVNLAQVCADEFGSHVAVDQTDFLDPPPLPKKELFLTEYVSFLRDSVDRGLKGIFERGETVFAVIDRQSLMNTALVIDWPDAAFLDAYHGLIFEFSDTWGWDQNLEEVQSFSSKSLGFRLETRGPDLEQ